MSVALPNGFRVRIPTLTKRFFSVLSSRMREGLHFLKANPDELFVFLRLQSTKDQSSSTCPFSLAEIGPRFFQLRFETDRIIQKPAQPGIMFLTGTVGQSVALSAAEESCTWRKMELHHASPARRPPDPEGTFRPPANPAKVRRSALQANRQNDLFLSGSLQSPEKQTATHPAQHAEPDRRGDLSVFPPLDGADTAGNKCISSGKQVEVKGSEFLDGHSFGMVAPSSAEWPPMNASPKGFS